MGFRYGKAVFILISQATGTFRPSSHRTPKEIWKQNSLAGLWCCVQVVWTLGFRRLHRAFARFSTERGQRYNNREFQLHKYVEQKLTLIRAFVGHWPITKVDLYLNHVKEHVDLSRLWTAKTPLFLQLWRGRWRSRLVRLIQSWFPTFYLQS